MNAARLFLERHRPLHEELIPLLLEPLSDEDLRVRPGPGMNPIGWILWHAARAEDVGLNRFVTDRTQVFDGGEWDGRMGVERRDIGTGMEPEEVERVADRLALGEVDAYRKAVARRTARVVEGLDPGRLDTRLDRTEVERVLVDEGAAGPSAGWLPEEYLGHTRGWCLSHFGLTHNFYHLGQAFVARKILGAPGPW